MLLTYSDIIGLILAKLTEIRKVEINNVIITGDCTNTSRSTVFLGASLMGEGILVCFSLLNLNVGYFVVSFTPNIVKQAATNMKKPVKKKESRIPSHSAMMPPSSGPNN